MAFDGIQVNRSFINSNFEAFKFQPKVATSRQNDALQRENTFNVAQNTLAKNLTGVDGSSAKLPTPTDFSPEEIAKNVLSFVRDRLQSAKDDGADPEKLKSILNAAKAGVAQGFKEATDILQEQGLLTDDTKAGIGKAKEFIDIGLSPQQPDGDERNVVLFEAAQSLKQTRKNSFQIQVTTQDGDQVTIKFKQSEKQSSSAYFQQKGDTTTLSTEASSKTKTQFSFDVEGDLDQDELKSINALIGDINGVAETFFSGDSEAAFEQGLNLGFNTEEIAGFSLNLKQSTKSVATTAYREVSELGPGRSAPPVSNDCGRVATNLKSIFQQAEALFKEAESAFNAIFSPLLQNNAKSDLLGSSLEKQGKDFEGFSKELLSQALTQSDAKKEGDDSDS